MMRRVLYLLGRNYRLSRSCKEVVCPIFASVDSALLFSGRREMLVMEGQMLGTGFGLYDGGMIV